MAKLEVDAVVSAADYERVRVEYRARVSAARARRRMRLGSAASLQFETREFALWHVQELLRVEGWTLPRTLQTLDDVRPWCPRAHELVATLMVDSSDPAEALFLSRALVRPGAIILRAGSAALRSEVVEAGFPGDPVWYLRWSVTPAWERALVSGCTLATSWDDALYTLSAATRAALRTDLIEAAGPGQPLLHRLLQRTQHNAQSQRTRHQARP